MTERGYNTKDISNSLQDTINFFSIAINSIATRSVGKCMLKGGHGYGDLSRLISWGTKGGNVRDYIGYDCHGGRVPT